MTTELILALLLAAAVVLGYFYSRREYARGARDVAFDSAGLKTRAEDLAARLETAEKRLANAEQSFRDLRGEKGALEATAARVPVLEAELATQKQRGEEFAQRSAGLEASLREIRAREPEIKEALASFLQEKGQGLTKHNADTLKALLDPLQARIQEFERKVEEADKGGLTRHVELKTQLDLLSKMNDSLGQEARGLTLALKGENKTGGDWGELVLERVLESSGLEKDREYRVQPSFPGEDGVQRPDVVIDLPDNRHLVVDSKLSLVAYTRFCEAKDPAEAEAAIAAHVQSVRQHVDQLSGKKYHEIHALNSVDFVFLFMPVEPAFIEASRRDASLFQAAFAKNIIIVSPSTLLATLRTVESIWKQERQNRNVREIARQATALYEKFVGFILDLDKVDKALSAAQATLGEAKSKLS
ncbi:MAG TPA: DNA recombination protein RmuC, partial [Fibrobacteria bacterium]|nr:DNA recombination protein RmuC [Fibrobacteria bacterium]